MHDAAMAVGDDLKFNVMRIDDEFLQVNLFVAKSFLRLVTRTVKSRFKARLVMCCAHSAPATAGSRLDHHRVSDFLHDFYRLVFCVDDAVTPRSHCHAGFACGYTSS